GRARRPPRLRFVDSNMIDLTRVSVVLPALNEAAALPVALASFPAQVDLVVVDHRSPHPTPRASATRAAPPQRTTAPPPPAPGVPPRAGPGGGGEPRRGFGAATSAVASVEPLST